MERFDIERITTSLSALEDNLKEIASAKEQVEQIETSSKQLIGCVDEYKNVLKSVSDILHSISDDSKDFISNFITDFNEKNNVFGNSIERIANYDFAESFEKYEKEAIVEFETELEEKMSPINTFIDNFSSKLNDFTIENVNLTEQVSKLVDFDFTETMMTYEQEALGKFNEELSLKMSAVTVSNQKFQSHIETMKDECNRLSNIISELEKFDFTDAMLSYEQKAIDQFVKELASRLSPLEELDGKLKSDTSELSAEISRLKSIDLLEHFNKHQSKLSEIFNSINSINVLLNQQLQNSNMLVGQMNNQFREINDKIERSTSETKSQIETIQKQGQDNTDKLQESIAKLSSAIDKMNLQLRKITETQNSGKTMATINVVVSVVVLIILIILMLKK